MSYQPIENYGIIGNMRTVALVGMNGSIDWYCYPHFDSPSVFGAILDDKNGGCFRISADSDGVRHKQFYWPSTNVLVTRFLLADGIAVRTPTELAAELAKLSPGSRVRIGVIFHTSASGWVSNEAVVTLRQNR